MGNWPTLPVGDLCQLINGRAFKPSEWGLDGLPIVRIQNLNDHEKPFNYYDGDYNDRHLIDDGEILLSWSGTPGTSFGCFRWLRGRALLNQHIFKVSIDDAKIDGDFFIYAVNSRLDEMIRQAHGGVGLRHITKGKLSAIHLPVPPLDEQRRIVARIKECMERVEEIEGLRAGAIGEVGFLSGSLYAAIENSGGWPQVSVGEVINRSRNGRSIRQDSENATGHVLTLSSVHDVTLDLSHRKPVVLDDRLIKQFAVYPGDVFVSRSNTKDLVGLSSVAEEDSNSLIYPDLLIKLEADRSRVLPRFLAYSLRTPSCRDQIKSRAFGTSQSMVKISGERLKEVTFPLPPIEVQKELIKQFDVLHDISGSLISEMSSCSIPQLRESILRKAFAGEL